MSLKEKGEAQVCKPGPLFLCFRKGRASPPFYGNTGNTNMPRARNIKPGTFKNDILADCEPLARLLFIALWCLADREGRLEYRPKKIKAEALPYDDCDVVSLLIQLDNSGFIVCYEANNIKYIQIVNFTKHQRPHNKEVASTIPAPTKDSASTNQGTVEHQPKTPDTGYLNPDLYKEKDTQEGILKEKPKRKTQLPKDWKPTDDNISVGLKEGYSLLEINWLEEGFRLHAKSTGRTQKCWNGAFSTWLLSGISHNNINVRRRSQGGGADEERQRINAANEEAKERVLAKSN